MNKNYEDINIPDNIDESIKIGVEKAKKDISIKSNRRKIKLAVSFSLIFILITFNKALANIPIVGKVFEMVEEISFYPNNYSEYATSINESVTSKGITITISEVVCDGRGIYVGYVVESKRPFKFVEKYEEGYEEINQLLINQKYNKVDFLEEELNISGFSGIQGSFIDDHTFVGYQRYKFNGDIKVPYEFTFKTHINSIENFDRMGKKRSYIKNGNWSFEIPVKTSRNLSKTINLNNQDVESEFVRINSIYLTEFETEINIEYKNNYYEEKQSDKVRFDLRVYDDENEEVYSTSADGVGNKFRYELESAGLDSKSIKVEIVEELYAPDENGYLILANGERLGVIEEKIILSKVINIE